MYLIANYLWPPDLFFGMDAERAIHDLSKPGHNIRGNVHPLFAPMFKPFSLLLQKLGISAGISAILMNSGAASVGIILAGIYARMRGAARLDALLAAALLMGSATLVVQGSIPGTFAFSLIFVAAGNVLLAWHLQLPDEKVSAAVRKTRLALWHGVGLANFGVTNSNFVMSFLNYGLAGRELFAWKRALRYAAILLPLGFLLAWLCKSSLDLWVERRWLYEGFEGRGPNLDHPFWESLCTALFWSVVAPCPALVTTLDERHWQIAAFHSWDYSPIGACLVLLWIALLAVSCFGAAREDAVGRKLTLALLASLAFHVALHSFYYVSWEGLFGFSGHSVFLVVGLTAPGLAWISRLDPRWRNLARIVIALFAFGLFARHFEMLISLKNFIPLPHYPYK